jgi:hypothetical protein
VKLRITVLQTAVSSLINTLNGLDVESRFQLGLYTFGREFKTVYALSPDVANTSAAVVNILPGVNFCSGDSTCGDTYFSIAMSQLTAVDKLLPQTGNNVPQRFLLIVSDGVYDQYLSSRQIGAFSPADCATLKALGVSILVLYTRYTPIPSNSYCVQRVQPISGQIVPTCRPARRPRATTLLRMTRQTSTRNCKHVTTRGADVQSSDQLNCIILSTVLYGVENVLAT